MQNLAIGTLMACVCAFSGWTIFKQFQPEPVSITIGEESDEIVFLNLETGATEKGEWQPTPAIDPRTGKRSLVQGLYCAKCSRWYPAPPPEMAEHSPRGPVCPKDGTGMSVDGPLNSAAPSSR